MELRTSWEATNSALTNEETAHILQFLILL